MNPVSQELDPPLAMNQMEGGALRRRLMSQSQRWSRRETSSVGAKHSMQNANILFDYFERMLRPYKVIS